MIISLVTGKRMTNKKYSIRIEKLINKLIKYQIWFQFKGDKDEDYESYYDNFVDGRGF